MPLHLHRLRLLQWMQEVPLPLPLRLCFQQPYR
jgi:hypothetical protein